ncbi:hypothetical protein SAMN05443543_107138 [Flavobacterium flevense]|nr:hypothetical protein [Flavobacterium flevense]SHL93949.1 hypothetical protein SAMN05443543_107138 [Flavobacterium flevense]
MKNQNKGGRPKVEDKRKIGKTIWFTESENKILTTLLTEGEYQSYNELIRDIVINKKYQVISLDSDSRIQKNILIEQTRRIGNNFNQLIKHFNEKKLDHFTKEEILALLKLLNDIKIIYERIQKTIKE